MIDSIHQWALDHSFDLWIVLVGIICNAACALLGCFLVLRRMSLLGDAISHAILPGLALAFLLTGTKAVVPMFLAAMVMGIFTAFLSQGLHRFARVSEDSSLGVVFTSLFALGVILISWSARQVDLDPGCVLYGLLELVPFDRVPVLGMELPRAFLTMSVVLVLDLAFVLFLWKELKISSFDPGLATTLGINATLIHYLLMGTVAATTVSAFEAVGSILVIAMMIAPPAAAHLLTDRLWRMVVISVLIGAVSAVLGYLLAVRLNTSTAGAMATIAGAQYFLAVLLAPRYGIISKGLHRLALTLKIVREDVLALLYRWGESKGDVPLETHYVRAALGGGLLTRAAMLIQRLRGKVDSGRDGMRLTGEGKEEARDLILGHRLWETYLRDVLGLPLDHLHDPAERMEHYITPRLRTALESQLETPRQDPHGKPMPGRNSQ